MEAPRAVAVVEVTKEVEVMLASEPEEMPEAAAPVEEGARVEKVVESEEVITAQTPVPPAAMPQPGAGGGDVNATMNAPDLEEATPQPEVLALESAPAAEERGVSEAEHPVEDNTGTLSATGEGEWMGYEATEPAVEGPHEKVAVRRLQTPSWWLPAALGAVTLLLAGITYWISRRR
jgi:hypothetical protein